MAFPVPCIDDTLPDLVDVARMRLAHIADALRGVQHRTAVIAAEVQWDSDAARRFGTDADDLTRGIGELAGQVEAFRESLQFTRVLAQLRSAGWCA